MTLGSLGIPGQPSANIHILNDIHEYADIQLNHFLKSFSCACDPLQVIQLIRECILPHAGKMPKVFVLRIVALLNKGSIHSATSSAPVGKCPNLALQRHVRKLPRHKTAPHRNVDYSSVRSIFGVRLSPFPCSMCRILHNITCLPHGQCVFYYVARLCRC